MKRFVRYALTLFVAVVAMVLTVDYLNVRLICSSFGNSAYKMKRLYENPEPDEIAIVGSSRAEGNFVPSVISERCFDYGVAGMSMHEVLPILDVLRGRPTEAPVIVNLDPWGNFGHRIVADYRLAPQSGRLSFGERMPGIRFFGALRKNLVAMIDARRSVTRVIDKGASLLKVSRTESEWRAINSKMVDLEFRCDVDDQQRLITALKSFSPRRVCVVVCPCSASWMAHFLGRRELGEFLNRIKALANVKVYDYYGSPEFSDADFSDPTHFNIIGAQKFSALLKSEIAELGK